MKRSAAALLAAGALACRNDPAVAVSPHGFVGTELATPVAKPTATFTDSRGRSFRFDSATAGKVTLVFFGYTHCPDVCPVHLANLAAVLDKMPEEVQRAVAVVFVTTDPARDSLPVLDAWVKGFDAGFIGLTAPDSIVRAAEVALGLPASEPGERNSAGGYPVGHSTAMIAYTRDGKGRVEYPFGTRQKEWAHDLPMLVSYGQ